MSTNNKKYLLWIQRPNSECKVSECDQTQRDRNHYEINQTISRNQEWERKTNGLSTPLSDSKQTSNLWISDSVFESMLRISYVLVQSLPLLTDSLDFEHNFLQAFASDYSATPILVLCIK